MTDSPVPAICVSESAAPAFRLFNPNQWQPRSKGLVQSCATELAVLNHSSRRINELASVGMELCRPYFRTLNDQWSKAPWQLDGLRYFAQAPDLHVYIEGFFASLQTLLDLSARLLTTERVVNTVVDGFHRAGAVYGGRVLETLANNPNAARPYVAEQVAALIADHKARWIDDVIAARDLLLHPIEGAQQVMFEIRLKVTNGVLEYDSVRPPHVGEVSIDEYAAARVADITRFCTGLIPLIRESFG